jgi:hypothetical protein
MSTHERLWFRKGISHAINTMSGQVAECGATPRGDSDWRGWEQADEVGLTVNSGNRQCKSCIRLVGSDW